MVDTSDENWERDYAADTVEFLLCKLTPSIDQRDQISMCTEGFQWVISKMLPVDQCGNARARTMRKVYKLTNQLIYAKERVMKRNVRASMRSRNPGNVAHDVNQFMKLMDILLDKVRPLTPEMLAEREAKRQRKTDKHTARLEKDEKKIEVAARRDTKKREKVQKQARTNVRQEKKAAAQTAKAEKKTAKADGMEDRVEKQQSKSEKRDFKLEAKTEKENRQQERGAIQSDKKSERDEKVERKEISQEKKTSKQAQKIEKEMRKSVKEQE